MLSTNSIHLMMTESCYILQASIDPY